MMFGAPVFLWALPAAALPLVLHFLNRRKPKAVQFSHLALLKFAHQSRMPKRRLRDLLLLALRTLFVLFLVALFARPVARKGGFLGRQEGRVVVLLDVSASMGATVAGRDRLGAAKEEVQRVLASLPEDAEIGFVTFSDRVEAEQSPTRDRARLIGLIASAKVRARPSNVLPALKTAAVMAQGAEPGTVVIVSDHASNVWRAASAARGGWDGHDPRTRFILADLGEPPASRGIVEANLQLSEEGNLRGKAVFLSNRGAASPVWDLELNGRVVGKGESPASAGRMEEQSFQAQLPEGGYFAGRLSMSADAMPFDDVFFLAGRVPKGFRLLIVDGERGAAPSDSEVYYLRSSLEAPRDPRIEAIDIVTPDGLASASLNQYSAIVAANAAQLGGREGDLRSWLENGGGLFLAPGSRWPKAGAQVLGLVRTGGRVRKTATVKQPKSSDGLLSGIAGLDGFEWSQVSVEERIALEADPGWQVLLETSDGAPLLSQRRIGKGNLAVLATSLDRSWTNLPSKPVFAPLMRELVSSLADPLREQASLQAYVDEPLRLRLPEGTRSVSVVAPDGSVASAGIDGDGRLEWTPPPQTGLYEARTDRPDQWFKIAVNMRDLGAEADVRRVRESDVKDALGGATVQWSAYRPDGSGLAAVLQGRELTNVLIVLLFLILLSETLLAWRSAPRAA